MSTEITPHEESGKMEVFGNSESFEHGQRVAKMLSSSSLIPKEYQNNIQNTMIALEMANRIGANPLMVMQNLYIVHGKPSWSSTFIIASINACGKFSPLRYEMSGEGEKYGCIAWAYDKETKERLEGPKVTWEMANAEGWVNKSGSKWKTMPELMFRYRAAAFFGRLYAPELLMGILTADETEDISHTVVSSNLNRVIEKPLFTEAEFELAFKSGAEISLIESGYSTTPEIIEKYRAYVASQNDSTKN